MLPFIRNKVVRMDPQTLYYTPHLQDPKNISSNLNILFMAFRPDQELFNLRKWDGEILRNSDVGFSGTNMSIVMMAEALSSAGHTVWVGSNSCNDSKVIHGVNYISHSDIHDIEGIVDVLVIPTWVNPNMDFKWKRVSKLVLWSHLKLFPREGILQRFKALHPDSKIYYNAITEYVHKWVHEHHPYYTDYIHKVGHVRNPILLDMARDASIKTPHSFIFPASFVRGGDVACQVFDGLTFPDKTMTVCSYIGNDIVEHDKYKIQTLGKRKLYETLAKTEYFVYPGVCSKTTELTKETDSCCVAECLLHEVIVVAFKVGALYENYGDCVVWIPFPSNANTQSIQKTGDTFEPELCSPEVIKSIQDIIYQLDSNPGRKTDLRRKGRELVMNQRNLESLKSNFLSFIDIKNNTD
jgi:hypothetical protein